ncbi:cell division protein PerM [Streptoalloteichus hindustanus]|uniref:cell division protein PerM n=1 Tax=Streptoalloteichus hindustanus TaxID=2017 RepID=UPI000936B0E1|nr:DUF6350 family protein [Streptoalloteichus hindustanus]
MTAIQPVPHGVAEPVGATRVEWARAMAAAAVWPLFTGFTAAATVVAVVLSATPGADFSSEAVLRGAAPMWLAAHQVPLVVRGVPFGALPLLPTLLVVLLALRAAGLATERVRPRTWEQAAIIVSAVGGAHGVFGAVLAGLAAGPVTAEAATAFFGCGLVAGVGAAVGILRRAGARARLRRRADPAAVRGLRAGALGLIALFTAGAALTTLGLLLSAGTAHELFAEVAPDAGSAFGLWLLSVSYLPNAVTAAVAFLVGPGFAIGQMAVSPLSTLPGAVPPMPLLAALPAAEAERWWALAFVAPLAVGVLVGWVCRRCDPNPLARLRVVAVAAAVVGLASFLVAALAGGRLGSGAFDPVTVPAGLVAVAAFCWISFPGAVVAWFGGPRPARAVSPASGVADADVESRDGSGAEADDETGAGLDAETGGGIEAEAEVEVVVGSEVGSEVDGAGDELEDDASADEAIEDEVAEDEAVETGAGQDGAGQDEAGAPERIAEGVSESEDVPSDDRVTDRGARSARDTDDKRRSPAN